MGLLSVGGNIIRIGNNTISAGPPDIEIYVTPSLITSVSYLGATCSVNVCGSNNNSVVVADACTWLVTTTPVTPSSSPGTVNNIQICENITSSCRSGVVCYTPSLGGTMKCVTICQSTGDTNIYVTPSAQTNINSGGANVYEYVCGPTSNNTSFSTSCTWIHATTPVSPCATPGRAHLVCIDANTGVARQGTACYIPTVGTMRTITFCQNEAPVDMNMCYTGCNPDPQSSDYYQYACGLLCRSSNPVSGSYYACFNWSYYIGDITGDAGNLYWCILCNTVCKCGCSCYSSGGNVNQYGSICIGALDYNDTICVLVYAQTDSSGMNVQACTSVYLSCIYSCQSSPCFCAGGSYFIEAYTCGA
jgi:hypothetical protein